MQSCGQSRFLLIKLFVACCVSHLTAQIGFAGTIRDDRRDAVYQGLAAQPQFRASGFLGIRSGTALRGSASATLIAPTWVLTAAHCVYDEFGPAGDTWTFELADQVIEVPARNVYFPREWVTSGFDSGYDVAMIQLPTAVRGIRPASIAVAKDEVGKVISTVGYGTTGTGLTGNTADAGTRRAGQNIFDATQATIVVPGFETRGPQIVGSDRTLLYDFDNPQGTASTLGQKTPLNLEYSAAPGDSGGAAFVQVVGTGVRVVGVVSAGWMPNGLAAASYGTTAVYARVADNAKWMRSAMAGNEPPLPMLHRQLELPLVQRAVAESRQRVEVAIRKGLRVQRFIALPARTEDLQPFISIVRPDVSLHRPQPVEAVGYSE